VDHVERQVVCIGGAVLDRKFHLVAPSVAGTSNPAGVSTSPGGVARNVAENLAGLLVGRGIRVELVSAIGDDDAGAALLARLRARGVGVERVRRSAGEATAQYIAVLEPGGDLTIGIAAMAVLDRVDVAAVDQAWPQDGWVFCDTNLAAPVLAHAVRRARTGGVRLAVDAVSTLKVGRLPADLRGIALLSCNRDEARAWLAEHGRAVGGPVLPDSGPAPRRSGPAPPDRPVGADGVVPNPSAEHGGPEPTDAWLADRLRAVGADAVLLTRGAAGVVMADRTGVHELPSHAAEVVDVTGAGDALIAGTLATLITSDLPDLQAAVRSGIRLAARTVASVHSVLPDPSD
jgi:sugar/nucleoside kinase (ribokinase family)